MAFEKGQDKKGGRVAGTPNKLGTHVKDTFVEAFNILQECNESKLSVWAKNNPTEFYKICAKFIPQAVEMKAELEHNNINYDEFIKQIKDA